jgi:hypothetical protein
MKIISNEIVEFLKKHFSKCIENIHLKNNSKSYIKTIFEIIDEANDEFDSIIFEETMLTNNDFLQNTSFNQINSVIQDHIWKTKKIVKKYSMVLKGRSYTIYIVHFIEHISNGDSLEKTLKRIYRKMDNQFRQIYAIIYLETYMATKLCKGPLHIYIYMTSHTKTLPSKGEPIDTIHANTGFTHIACDSKTELHVYREEEWLKVFIHELFHNVNLDFSTTNNQISKVPILKLFPINSDVNLSETYCEIWAELIHLVLIVYEKNKVWNIKKMVHDFEELLKYERIFSLFQAIKILHHYDLKYQDLYQNTPQSVEVRKSYRENTNVLAYYIIKSLFMFHIADYIEWVLKHNGSMQFKMTHKNIETYCNYVKELHKSEKYISYTNAISLWFAQHNTRNTKIMKTLRMTTFEL